MKIFVSESEVNRFRVAWPCSNLPTDTGITFEYATNGVLTDITLSNDVDSSEYDGPALLALSQDAQSLKIGKEIFNGSRIIRDAMKRSVFVDAYIDAMFFTDGAESTDELYEMSVDDFSFDLATSTVRDCAIFEAAHSEDIADDPKRAGHDFWLTRNGHGAGFWDGDWPEDIGEKLTETSKAFGEVTVYRGDDGLIYS